MSDNKEDHGLLRDSVAKFLGARYDIERRREIAASEAGWSRDIWREMAELGLLAAAIPAEAGGFAEGIEEALVVMEEFGRRLVVEPFSETAIVAGTLIAKLGTAAQRSDLLPPIMAGDAIWALAHEEGYANGADDVRTVAILEGEGYRIDGAKAVVAAAGWADRLLVSARIGAAGDGALALFIVDPQAAGVGIERYRTLDGRGAADISLSGVLVAAGALLGAGGDAGAALGDAVDFAVAAQCAEALGITSVLNAATVEYAKVRQQFGQPIGRFQALQHRLVDMYVAESEARGMAATLPALFGMANRRSAAVSAAKVQIAEAGRLIAEEAIQIHGGMGMTQELSIGDYAKRMIALTMQHGDVRAHLDRFVALEMEAA